MVILLATSSILKRFLRGSDCAPRAPPGPRFAGQSACAAV